jgi:hypothetical protein
MKFNYTVQSHLTIRSAMPCGIVLATKSELSRRTTVLPEKLTVSKLVKNFPTFYGIRMFVTMFKVPLHAWCGPDFMTTQDGGKVVSLTHRPPLPQEIYLVLISVRG